MRRDQDPRPARRGVLVASAVAALIGSALGVGGFTFHYAEGASYLSTDPRACVNCHIMQPQYDSWQKASHHTVAACVDCHLPPSGLAKWIAKAENGWNHSKGFTLQDFAEPIRIKGANPAILQENCLRCHADLLHDQVAGATTDRDAIQCIHCHRDVGHGPTAGLGGRDLGLELERRAR
ncbi:MAG: cytochrome c nitrite reductase small subunit [Planctomycetes bacterium]|nr:cytochrome c nitrite reductase small subunit [Planctomycetota bacterium]